MNYGFEQSRGLAAETLHQWQCAAHNVLVVVARIAPMPQEVFGSLLRLSLLLVSHPLRVYVKDKVHSDAIHQQIEW